MAKAKKFGAFSGVFTPSVLTILGVIMYMRLGWVVGTAGLITALIIIIISHVISITTGLSISSVATDKKIKTGGIYYILSRSLGFPMGGAIGIALFIGTALGISLYLVGFAESLLSVDSIREFLNLKQDINSYRIIGSAALLLLVTIAFISTSLAIKSQYFILAAIALSLISIAIGFFINTDAELVAESISLSPIREDIDIQVIFGVFFPAVTGFTAGVAMSGDLKNPKKDIPVGTLASIFVGFIIYVGLAISFAFFVNRDLLVNDYNFLLKIAYFAPLVLAGIWGATLSSALGGILGGPRILQAISKDKITPKIFAKGYGASNEPRNALIFIFLIAEGGILIGELNVIAGIVSMFYLASYGFINLAFFLENWASTDFRPSFKVKGIIGLIGFIASFAVMAQLGIMSMIAALVIMFGLFAWLNRKQLKSESGDVWQSVWLSIVRKALHSLDKKSLEERNWQPNVILFSGAKGQRPHLMNFGKNLVGQYGLLSNFDLHESKDKTYLFPKHLQSQFDEEIEGKGIFIRRQTCSDIYTGIETIISTYGFSGIEPNTVLMGWMRQSKEPVRFSKMLRRIQELDMNILLMDYDKRFGYGNYKTIDIWWRGSGNNGNLALNLVKFLWASEEWADAKLRLLVGNPINEEATKIRNHAEQVLSNMRIDAEIKIINNQIEQKPFYELIRTESLKTDLIILGLPEVRKGKETEFVEQTNKLMYEIGTVVLIKASSQFKEQIVIKRKQDKQAENNELDSFIKNSNEIVPLLLPENPIANEELKRINNEISKLNIDVYNNGMKQGFEKYDILINSIIQELDFLIDEKINNFIESNLFDIEKKIIIAGDLFLSKSQSILNKFIDEDKEILNIPFEDSYNKLISGTEKILSQIPDSFIYSYSEEENKNNSKLHKSKVKFKKPVNNLMLYELLKIHYSAYKKYGARNIENIVELRKIIKETRNSLLKLKTYAGENKLSIKLIQEEKEEIKSKQSLLEVIKSENKFSIFNFINNKTTEAINKISNDIQNVKNKSKIKSNISSKKISEIKEKLQEVHIFLNRNEDLLKNHWKLELQLLDFETKLYRISKKSTNSVEVFVEKEVLFKIQNIKSSLNTFLRNFEKDSNAEFKINKLSEIPSKETIFRDFKKILDTKFEKFKYLTDKFPQSIKLLTNESFNDLNQKQFEELETVDISASALVDYIIQTEFNTPLIDLAEKLPEEIIRIENSAQNILRLILFTFFDADGKIINKEKNTPEIIVKFIKEKITEINLLEKESKLQLKNINRNIDERLSEVSNKLVVYSLIKQAGVVKRFSKKQTKNYGKFRSKLKKINSSTAKQFNQIWYRHSDAVILRDNIIKGNKRMSSNINRSIDIVEKVSVKNEVLHNIPFFYQQLFLRTNKYNKDFFIGRTNELQEIKKSIERYKAGYKGAIMIIGERYSGKTFLSQFAGERFFPDYQIYTITPPTEGSVSIKTFRTKIAIEFDEKGSYERKFSKIQNKSLIIFDEAELWWEKSENGFEVINEIIELIETYGSKFLFIVNINKYAFNVIKLIENIESHFINIVECKPFNARQLKDAVLFRHNSGGLQLKYNNKIQEDVKQREFAKLFARYFNYSHGNIGVTLFSWISNIKNYKNNIIEIKSAKIENTNVFDTYDIQINIILSQFIIHKRLTISKLSRIIIKDEEFCRKQLAFLKRSGIIIEETKGIFEINKFMYIYIKQKMEEKEMI